MSGQEVLERFDRACSGSWRLADGCGGYAAGTAAGAGMRREHVLLAAGTPEGPLALLARVDDRALLPGVAAELSPSYAPNGSVRWGAFANLEHFAAEPWPTWRWRFESWLLEKRVRVIHGHPAVIVSWRLLSGDPLKLAVAPQLVCRAPEALQQEDSAFAGARQGIPGRARIESLPGAPALTLWYSGAFMPSRGWTAVGYPGDLAIEDDDRTLALPADQLFIPGAIHAEILAGQALHLVASTDAHLFRTLAGEQRLGSPPAQTLDACVAAIEAHELERRAAVHRRAHEGADFTARQAAFAHGGPAEDAARGHAPLLDPDDPWFCRLAPRVLDATERVRGRTTLAPRAGGIERGGDVLRMVPALVALRDFERARDVLAGYLDYLDEGLVPEAFAPDGAPRFGDPAPALWLVHACELYVRRSGDAAFARELAWPALDQAMQHLRSGSRHGVSCDRDGLLWAAGAARADVNALWYHALVAMAQLGKLVGRKENAALQLAWARDLQRTYAGHFTDPSTGTLFESRTAGGPVRGIGPWQLLAVALPPVLLADEPARRLVAVIERELMTPLGLREAPDDGPPRADLLGLWASATLRAHGRSAGVVRDVESRFAALDHAAREGRLDLDALAAAELLRAWIEDGEHVRTGRVEVGVR